jgi:uncharacterized Zn-binding protein involved in type VI secretion
MPAVARKSGTDTVASPDGAGFNCASGTTQATNEGSSRVFSDGIGVVRRGDAMTTHPAPGCAPHAPTLDIGSTRVFVEGRGIGRLGDTYGGDHPITSGSARVFAG